MRKLGIEVYEMCTLEIRNIKLEFESHIHKRKSKRTKNSKPNDRYGIEIPRDIVKQYKEVLDLLRKERRRIRVTIETI